MTKILFVIDSFGSGGAQRQIVNLALAFVNKKYDVHVVAYKNYSSHFKSHLINKNITIHEPKCRDGILGKFGVLVSLYKIIKDDFDVIISFQLAANVYSALARFHRIRTLLIVSDRTSSMAPTSLFSKLMMFLTYKIADFVVSNSHSRKLDLQKNHGEKVHAIWNGYNLNSLVNIDYVTHKEGQSGFPISSIGVVGRLHHAKNPLRLLQALSIFYNENKYLPKIYWAGRLTPDKDSFGLSRRVSSYLQARPWLEERIVFMGEIDDVGLVYRKVDVLVHVSIYEGLPNVICEAMLVKCPIIASRVSDNELLLDNGNFGLLCNPYDPEDICKSLTSFSNMSVADKEIMTNNAKDFAQLSFNISVTADNYIKLIS